MKIKVCGMKFRENIEQVAALGPDYMGFIFYKGSKRCFEGDIPKIAGRIKKTGVFVNEEVSFITSVVRNNDLKAVQLHGEESPLFCESLRADLGSDVEIIKAFAVGPGFGFQVLRGYEPICDYYLFDAQGKYRGGNGTLFDWKVLEKYSSKKPFFLSGGIGLEEQEQVRSFLKTAVGSLCHCIDVNSKFESEPGIKKVDELKGFMDLLAKER